MKSEAKPLSLLWNDAIVAAIATLLGYGLVFAFEAGFCSVYRIPLALVNLNLTTALSFAFAATGLLIYMISLSSYISSLYSADDPTTLHLRANALLLTAFLAALFYRNFPTWLVAIAAIGVFASLGPLWRRFATKEPTGSRIERDYFFQLKAPIRLAIGTALIIFELVYVGGTFAATREPRYVFGQNGAQYLVLRIYGDEVIAAPYKITPTVTRFLWLAAKGEALRLDGSLLIQKLGATRDSEWRQRPAGSSIDPWNP